MNTDVFIKILSDQKTEIEMEQDIRLAFEEFRHFERRFSRFLFGNELSRLNGSDKQKVSQELCEILKKCKEYYEETRGIFDPAILTSLKREGYARSYEDGLFDVGSGSMGDRHTFSDVQILQQCLIQKPRGLLIDLGGIGKGYIVEKVAYMLSRKYEDVFVYAGGDIRVFGGDKARGYEYWVSDVEDPSYGDSEIATILLKDCAVATSGVNRRTWLMQGKRKHHLIDSRTGKSAETDILSVTVISQTAELADVWAKVLCILGLQEGFRFAKERSLPALFVEKSGGIRYTQYIEPYLWKEK